MYLGGDEAEHVDIALSLIIAAYASLTASDTPDLAFYTPLSSIPQRDENHNVVPQAAREYAQSGREAHYAGSSRTS